MDSAESSRELFEEVIEQEIMPRAEVKSLLRFRCVSKAWRSLIDSEPFINKHKHLRLRSSTNRCTRSIFHKCRCGPHFSPPYHHPPIDPSLIYNGRFGAWYVVGHHNGLLCIFKEQEFEGRFFLSNPATRISIRLPNPDIIVEKVKVGFGWDQHSGAGAYKVFLGVPDNDVYHDDEEGGGGPYHDGRIARIYSSETNTWRAVEHGSGSLFGKVGVFAGGRIYWLTRSGHIEYLELRNEVFGKMMIGPPRSIRFGDDDIWVWLWEKGGSLCIVWDTNNRTKRSVWVMKEKEKENDWVEDGGGGVASELSMEVHGVYGAFAYVETLVSPPPLLLEEEEEEE